ncbi:MAG TPA: hypothetical protein VJG90_06700 [Candidatus Nanoarchaeia archaeon]|nr:hypothetical protein [Candidatus Nanoarchaeia archaeon]
MNFCASCGAILKPEKGRGSVICPCGHIQMLEVKQTTEQFKQKAPIEVLHDGINPMASYDHKCKKCGFEKAQLVSKGIWISDESEVVEFACGKCGYHERAGGIKVT